MVSKFITYNRSGEHLNIQGIVLHDTATAGATAENEYKYFNSGNRDASAHAVVDWNGAIQTVPFDEVAWHCGYTGNHKYIGIEMCVPKTHNAEQFKKVWDNTVELFADLIKQYGLSVNDITTHNEVSLKWGETNHTDPTGYLKEYGKTIDDFRNDVKAKLNGGLTVTEYEKLEAMINDLTPNVYNYIDENMPVWAKPTIQKLCDKGILKGTDTGLNLTEEMMRMLVVLDRAKMFDK